MQKDFSKGSIFLSLTEFAIPVFFAMFLQSLYGAVDLMVVGHFALSEDVASVSTGAMVLQSITSLITGLSTAVTVILSRRIGEGEKNALSESIGAFLSFFVLLSLALTLILFFSRGFISHLMQVPEEALLGAEDYMGICSFGMLAISLYNLIGALFRGIGDSLSPLFTVLVATFINIGLDFLFVGPLNMGAKGAALATVIAQASSVLFSVFLLRRKTGRVGFSFKSLIPNWGVYLRIIRIGGPLALSDVLVSISFLFLMSIANSLGVVASAGVGVAEKICAFIMLLPSSFMQSMTAFVAQNEGAGHPERSMRGLKIAILMSLFMGSILFYLSFFHGDILTGIFTRDEEVINSGADYLKAYGIDTLLTSFLFCFAGYFTGKGKTLFVMANGLMGAFLVRVPLAYLFSRFDGMTLFMLGCSVPISTVFQISLCLIYLLITYRKDKRISMHSEDSSRVLAK